MYEVIQGSQAKQQERQVDGQKGEPVDMPGVEGETMTFTGEYRNIIDMPTYLEGLHWVDDFSGYIDDARHAAVRTTNGGASILDGTEHSKAKMLHLGRDGLRPAIVGHVDDDIGPICHKTGIQIAEDVLEADRGGEFYPFLGFEHHAFIPLFPPVVVIGQQQVVQQRQLFLIGEVLGERNKVLFAVGILDLAILKENNVL